MHAHPTVDFKSYFKICLKPVNNFRFKGFYRGIEMTRLQSCLTGSFKATQGLFSHYFITTDLEKDVEVNPIVKLEAIILLIYLFFHLLLLFF